MTHGDAYRAASRDAWQRYFNRGERERVSEYPDQDDNENHDDQNGNNGAHCVASLKCWNAITVPRWALTVKRGMTLPFTRPTLSPARPLSPAHYGLAPADQRCHREKPTYQSAKYSNRDKQPAG